MAKIWVDIVANVSPDGDEAKKVLTKAVKEKVQAAMVKATASALPDKYSDKDSDKPKDKRDDYAARAVRIVEYLKLTIETKGARAGMDGSLEIDLELLDLKSDKGKHAGAGKSSIKGLEKRGTIETQFDALIKELMKDLVAPLAAKLITSSSFENFAKQNNLPI